MKLGEHSSKHTFWATMDEQHKQDCVDHKRGRPIDSFTAWPPRGRLLDKWKEILPVILKLVNEPTNNDFIFYKSSHPRIHLCELLLIGDKPLVPHVTPTITVFCRQRKYAKRMVMVLQKSRCMSRMALGFDYLAHDTFQHDVRRVAGNSVDPPHGLAATDRNSLCGAGITVVSSGKDGIRRSRIATLGGLIEVNNQLYGMTTAHALLGSPASSESAGSSHTDESDEDEDASEDTSDTFEPVEDDESFLDSPHPHDALPDYRVYLRPAVNPQASPVSQEPSASPGRLLATHPDDSDVVRPIVSAANNVALLPISDSQVPRNNLVNTRDGIIQPSRISEDIPEGRVLVSSGSSGVWTSTTSAIPRGIILPETRRMAVCLTLEGTSAEGDSGSWVMDPDTGDVHAMVVATSASANETYCVPMSSVLARLHDSTGNGLGITLPIVPGAPASASVQQEDIVTTAEAIAADSDRAIGEVILDQPPSNTALDAPEQDANLEDSVQVEEFVDANAHLEDHAPAIPPIFDADSVEMSSGSTIPALSLTSEYKPPPAVWPAATESAKHRRQESLSMKDMLFKRSRSLEDPPQVETGSSKEEKTQISTKSSKFQDSLSMKDMLFQKNDSAAEAKGEDASQSQTQRDTSGTKASANAAPSHPQSRQQRPAVNPQRPLLGRKYSEGLSNSFASRQSFDASGPSDSDFANRPRIPRQSQQSNKMRVHRDLLFPATLDAWGLPWRQDPHDGNHIIIDRLLNEEAMEELYQHTDMLRLQPESTHGHETHIRTTEADDWSPDESSEVEGTPTVIMASTAQMKSKLEPVQGDRVGPAERNHVHHTHRKRYQSYSPYRPDRQNNRFPHASNETRRRGDVQPQGRHHRPHRRNRSRDRSSSRDKREASSPLRDYVLPQTSIATDSPVTSRSVTWLVEEHHDQAFLATMRDTFYNNDLPNEVFDHLATQFRQVQGARREAVAGLASAGLAANIAINAMNRSDPKLERRGTPVVRKDPGQGSGPGNRSRTASMNYSVNSDAATLHNQLKSPEGPKPRLQQPIPTRNTQNMGLGPGLLRYGSGSTASLEPIPGSPLPSAGTPSRTFSQAIALDPDPSTSNPTITPTVETLLQSRTASGPSNAPTPKPRPFRNESIYDRTTNSMILLIRGGRETISPAAFRHYSDLHWEYSERNPNDIIVRPWISDRMVASLMEYTGQLRDAEIRARIRGELSSGDDEGEWEDEVPRSVPTGVRGQSLEPGHMGAGLGMGLTGVAGLKRHKSMARRKSKWPAAPAGLGGSTGAGGAGTDFGSTGIKRREGQAETQRESEGARRVKVRPMSLYG